MKVSLNFTERLHLVGVLNSFKGELLTTATILEDLKVLKSTDDERKEVAWELKKVGDNEFPQWNREKAEALVSEVELSKESVDYFNKWVDEKDKKGEFGLSDFVFVGIKEKLNC